MRCFALMAAVALAMLTSRGAVADLSGGDWIWVDAFETPPE